MKHVVVGIISRKNADAQNEYLLVRAKKNFGEFTGYWYPPGGHLEENEDEKDALVREIKEELTIDVEPKKKIAESPGDVPDQVTSWWACALISDDIHIDREEITDARFFTKEEMEKMKVWPATRKFFQEHIFK